MTLDPRTTPIWVRGRANPSPLAGHVPDAAPPPEPAPVAGVSVGAAQPAHSSTTSTASSSGIDWALVAQLRRSVSERLAQTITVPGLDVSPEQEREMGRAILVPLVGETIRAQVARGIPAPADEDLRRLEQAVFDAVFGMGRFQPLLDDESVENITVVNGTTWTEHADARLMRRDPVAESDQELIEFLAWAATRARNPREFSPASPSLHLQLPDGSRLAATAWVMPRPAVVIRRHRITRDTLADLADRGMLSDEAARFLTAAVRANKSIVVAGAQGAGKTTFMRALSAAIPRAEKIGTFETELELGLDEMPDRHPIVFSWEARPGSGERGPDGRAAGEVTLAACLWDSFRFALTRQIVGEVRGPEAWVMIKAMESGSGSLSTTHATDAVAAIRKLTTCAMEASPSITHDLAVAKLAEAIDLVVFCHMEDTQVDEDTWQRQRWVSQIVAITPGEWPRGYAATDVFTTDPGGRTLIRRSLPEQLHDLLPGLGDAA